MVRADEVVVDGLGDADEADVASHLLAVARELRDGVHGVIAADVEHGGDARRVDALERACKEPRVGLGLRQLEAAAAEPAGGGVAQERERVVVRDRLVKVHRAPVEEALDPVAHADGAHALLPCAGDDPGEAGVDGGGGASGLSYEDALGLGHGSPFAGFPEYTARATPAARRARRSGWPGLTAGTWAGSGCRLHGRPTRSTRPARAPAARPSQPPGRGRPCAAAPRSQGSSSPCAA